MTEGRPDAGTPGSLGDLVRPLITPEAPDGPVVPVEPLRPGANPGPTDQQRGAEEKARREFLAALAGVPPAAVTARRAGAELRLEAFQPKVQAGGAVPVLNAAAGWADKLLDPGPPGGPGYPLPSRPRFRGGRP